jgi:hypothetical protein
MASPVEDLIDAINDDDSARVVELVTADPSLASARDRNGVSAIMLSRYRFDRETTDALLAADPDLDVFEATTLGYIDRLRERLAEDHWRATAYSTDGFTALHFAAFFGKVEAAGPAGRRRLWSTAYSVQRARGPAVAQRGVRAHPRSCRVLIAPAPPSMPRRPRVHGPPRGGREGSRCRLVELFLSAGVTDGCGPKRATRGRHCEAAGHVDVRVVRLREVAA